MDALPDLADKKRSLDMHTSVASAIVDEIKSRSLDKFFETEQAIDQEREGSLTQTVRQMLAPDSPGKPEDKLRLLACLFILRRTHFGLCSSEERVVPLASDLRKI